MKNKVKFIVFCIIISIITAMLNPFAKNISASIQRKVISIEWDYRCDINYDFKIDVQDMAEVSSIYNSNPNDKNWNKKCDINNDQIIDIFDI